MWQELDLNWAYGDLLKGIHRHTKCKQAAYDILHDALIRFAVLKHRDSILEPRAYLRSIANSILAKHYKDNSRTLSLDAEIEGNANFWEAYKGFQSEQSVAISPEHIADMQQRISIVQDIIDAFPPRCREVFWLFRIESLKQSEIATKLNISVNMVERHIIRALVDLSQARDLLNFD